MTKDPKRMVAEIRGALDAYPRDQLQEILAYVFKEYVVEGAAPATGAMAMLDARTELEGLSFAELMTWLQQHLDVPELALFDVANGRVSVRVGGRSVPLEVAAAAQAAAAQAGAAQAAAAQTPQPSAVSRQPSAPEVAAPATAAVAAAPVAPPTANAAQAPANAAPPTQTTTPPPTQTTTGQPANSQQSGESKEEPGKSSRFSWLEVD